MTIPELIRRVAECGFAVVMRTDGVPGLKQFQDNANLLPVLQTELKKRRDEIAGWLTVCDVCGRDVSDSETRLRMADALFCSRGGGKAVISKHGEVLVEETPRCPYK